MIRFISTVLASIVGLAAYQFYVLPRYELWLIQQFQSLP